MTPQKTNKQTKPKTKQSETKLSGMFRTYFLVLRMYA